MGKMKWTHEPPTKPGWYWRRRKEVGEHARCVLVKLNVTLRNPEFCYEKWMGTYDTWAKCSFPHTAEWSGPIPEPEEES